MRFIEELPDLELDDIKAALLYAVRKLDRIGSCIATAI
jgi:uncharacterized protein (DUF433 family)